MLRRLLSPALLFAASLIAVLIDIAANVATQHLPAGVVNSATIAWLSLSILLAAAGGVAVARRRVDDESQPEKDSRSFTSVVPAISQIPPDLSGFVGRKEEIEKLIEPSLRVITTDSLGSLRFSINGRPGVGKSRLAVRFAHLTKSNYQDRQLYLNLYGSTSSPLTPADALARLLLGLRVPSSLIPEDLDRRVELYQSITAPYRLLLLLDDAASAAQVRPLIPNSDKCAIIVTSRAALLGLESFLGLELKELPPEDAIYLIESVIGTDRIADETDHLTIGEIAKSCGFMPLALRIVAGQLAAHRSLTLSTMAKRLTDERKLLSKLTAEDISVRATFDSAYSTLPNNLRKMLALLGLLPHYPFSPPTAGALWGVTTERSEAVLQHLADLRLIDYVVRPGSVDEYCDIHSLLRLFLKEKVSADCWYISRWGAVRRVVRTLLSESHYADLQLAPIRLHLADAVTFKQDRMLSAERKSEISSNPTTWFDMEAPTLAALVATAHLYRFRTLAWQLASTLGGYYELRADWPHWQDVISMVLPNARRALNPAGEALFLANQGDLEAEQGNYEDAIIAFYRSRQLFQDAGNAAGEAYALSSIGNIEIERSHLDAAVAAFAQCLNLPRHDARVTALGERGLGLVRQIQGQFDEAIRLFKNSVQAAQAISDYHWIAINERSIGMTFHLQKRFAEAIVHLRSARYAFGQLGDLRWMARTDASLADSYQCTGQLSEAASMLQSALPVFQRLHDERWTIEAMRTLGLVRCRQDQCSTGLQMITDALALASDKADKRQLAIVRCNLGEGYLLCRQSELARETLAAAADAFRGLGDERWLAQCSALLDKA